MERRKPSLFCHTSILFSSQVWITLSITLRRNMEVHLKTKSANQPKTRKTHHNKTLQMRIWERICPQGSSPGIPQFLLLGNVTTLLTADCRAKTFLCLCPSHQFWLFKREFPVIKKVRVFPPRFYIKILWASNTIAMNYEGSTPPFSNMMNFPLT